MPNRQRHRGRHPRDTHQFSDEQIPPMREAVRDLSFLLTRGYAEKAAAKLVGDRFQLTGRQRRAVLGAACSDDSLAARQARCIPIEQAAGETIAIDGFNLLIGVESALSGGVLLRGRDGCIRDLASVHGSYRKVSETVKALELIGAHLERIGVEGVLWYFDAPVSNSGRLKTLMAAQAAAREWPWDVRLVRNPDALLAKAAHVVVTSDGWILDRAARWANLLEALIERIVPKPRVLDLSTG